MNRLPLTLLLIGILLAASVLVPSAVTEAQQAAQEPYTTKIENNKYTINYDGEIVTVGKGTNTFTPEITMSRWGQEAVFTLYEPTINGNPLSQKNAGSTLTGNTISWASKDLQFLFYPTALNGSWAFEYEIVLANSKAGTDALLSTITFPYTSSGLAFYPQPPLTEQYSPGWSEEFQTTILVSSTQVVDAVTGDVLVERPEDIVDSYAVYYGQSGDFTKLGGKDYKAGKVLHFKRIKLIDNAGDTAYAKMDFANGLFTLDFTGIADWLNKAKYPVVIDPTFGYEVAGASATAIRNVIAGSVFTGAAGNLDSMTGWIRLDRSSFLARMAVYQHSDLSFVGESDEMAGDADDNTGKWRTADMAGAEAISAQDYVLVAWANYVSGYTASLYYDSGAANQGHTDSATYNGFPDPLVPSHNNNKYSIYATYTSGGPSLPTVTTQAATSVEDTTATGNGNITDTGGENCDLRGVVWDDATHGDPGNVAPAASDYVTAGGGSTSEGGSFGTGAFTASMTGLWTGTTVYYRAWAHNSAGYSYGGEQNFLTKPAAPTNIAATDGTDTSKVVVTWTKSTGASNYTVYRDAVSVETVGDVATYDDTGADAPTITVGTASATDGSDTSKVVLSLAGESANNGTTHTYKVTASNATGASDDSATDTGYRDVGALTYQWERSAADSDAAYGDIVGATTDPYDDTAAPAPTITPGSTDASDGSSGLHVTLTLVGASANDGDGRYYKCTLNATGATEQTSTADRGYRGVGALTYQWQRSAADSDAAYGDIAGATTDPYDDTAAPAPTITPGTGSASDGTSSSYVTLSVAGEVGNDAAGRWYQCVLDATGAAQQTSASNRGYRGATALSYQWRRSSADADADFSNIVGAVSDPYNDTGGVVDPDGRWYYAEVIMSGATTQDTTHNRGYMSVPPAAGAYYAVFDANPLRIMAVSLLRLQITWPNYTGAVQFMLRVKSREWPMSVNSGTVVYQGTGVIAFDIRRANARYTLFVEDSGGNWVIAYRGHL